MLSPLQVFLIFLSVLVTRNGQFKVTSHVLDQTTYNLMIVLKLLFSLSIHVFLLVRFYTNRGLRVEDRSILIGVMLYLSLDLIFRDGSVL